ncbi:hypothetical protein [Lysobacter olei]
MARRKHPSQRLARQMTELAFAAPQVVAQRTSRMAVAGTLPTGRDHAEFVRMGTEKMHAFYQSWSAMWMAAWMAPFELAKATTLAPASAFALASRSAMGVMSAGLAPVHRKAVANAKRLSR